MARVCERRHAGFSPVGGSRSGRCLTGHPPSAPCREFLEVPRCRVEGWAFRPGRVSSRGRVILCGRTIYFFLLLWQAEHKFCSQSTWQMLSSAKEGGKGGRYASGKVAGELRMEFSFYKTSVRRRTWDASERAKQQKQARSKKKKTILHLKTKNLTTLHVWVFILIKKLYIHICLKVIVYLVFLCYFIQKNHLNYCVIVHCVAEQWLIPIVG